MSIGQDHGLGEDTIRKVTRNSTYCCHFHALLQACYGWCNVCNKLDILKNDISLTICRIHSQVQRVGSIRMQTRTVNRELQKMRLGSWIFSVIYYLIQAIIVWLMSLLYLNSWIVSRKIVPETSRKVFKLPCFEAFFPSLEINTFGENWKHWRDIFSQTFFRFLLRSNWNLSPLKPIQLEKFTLLCRGRNLKKIIDLLVNKMREQQR